MLNRSPIIDENFTKRVKEENFPQAQSITAEHLEEAVYLELFQSQLLSRHLDIIARELRTKNACFYTIASSGHETNAAVARACRYDDMAFLHYRSAAFMLERARALADIDMVRDILLSLVASSDDPIAAGRHKVFGSLPLFVPPQTSTIASHLPKALGMALSITMNQNLSLRGKVKDDSVVVCSFGDASVNHASALCAFNSAEWLVHSHVPLPIVFICEDNGLGISVPTPPDWIAGQFSKRAELQYIVADGLSLESVYAASKQAFAIARGIKKPVFLHLKMRRLMGHAGSDIESQYLSQQQIEDNESNDPLLHSARDIIARGYGTSQQVIDLYESTRQRVQLAAEWVIKKEKLSSAQQIMASIIPDTVNIEPLKNEIKQTKLPRNLAQMLNLGLEETLSNVKQSVIFGEDVAKKGGVYHVTAGLLDKFGPLRVFNTLLDEQTIIGSAIGMAMNGLLPIAEIQFLAYVHNAEDQIRGEAATLSYFSCGQFTNPLILRIPSLAYQKGFGGHFHNDNSIAVFRDIPGVIIACPSHGFDAVAMLRQCVKLALQQQRVVIFLEPIALYMTKDLHQAGDNLWLSHYPEPEDIIELGELGVYGDDDAKQVILSYGNGLYLSLKAQKILQESHGIKVRVVDLRWLAPLNEQAILQQVQSADSVLIVDECRKTGSISEALVTLLVENDIHAAIARITAQDCFIPLADAANLVLPSEYDIVEKIYELTVKE